MNNKRCRSVKLLLYILMRALQCAAIQKTSDNDGFRVTLRLHGMIKLLVLCIDAKVSNCYCVFVYG